MKTFKSKNHYFSLELPIDWDEYDDGDNTTYLFFNTKVWTGNLRITHFLWNEDVTSNAMAEEFINDEIDENKEAIRIRVGKNDAVFYSKELVEDDERFMVYYWIIGEGNDLFTCSFTTRFEENKNNEKELHTVNAIVSSIRIQNTD